MNLIQERPTVVSFVLGTLLLSIFGALAQPSAPANSDKRADFEWFSSLGFPDVKGKPFVRIATGLWSQVGGSEKFNYYEHGFLLATNANTFSCLTLDLEHRTFTNTPSGEAEHKRVGYDIADLKTHASNLLTQVQDPSRERWYSHAQRLAQPAELFVTAWACSRHGLLDESDRLYDWAAVSERRLRGAPPADTTQPFRIRVEQEIAHLMMWRAIEAFGNTEIPRSELLKEFELILKNYPNSGYKERAQHTVSVLKKMVAEDAAHENLGDVSKLTVEQQIDELIFQLRDQHAIQMSQPGWVDVVASWTGKTNTPAHQLVAIGYPAVPKLIASLDDERFSRSVGCHRSFYFSHSVLTVGNCAAQILERITGKDFNIPVNISGKKSDIEEIAKVRKAAESWWKEYQEKGQKQVWIEAVAQASEDAPAFSSRLLERYPDVAIDALAKGIQAAKDSGIRQRLVETLGTSKDPKVEPLLLEELRNGPTLYVRMTAAFALRDRGNPAALSAMISEWPKPVERKDRDAKDGIIGFLASSDSPDAIRALMHNLDHHSVDVRYRVIETIGEANNTHLARSHQKPSPPTLAAIEEALVSALTDVQERIGASGSRYEFHYSDPRICDMAAYQLFRRWPEKYQFDWNGAVKVRDRQRIECLNTWRTGRGMDLLPLPAIRSGKVAPGEESHVTAIEWNPDGVQPQKEFSHRVETLRGGRFHPEALIQLLREFIAAPHPDCEGIDLKATRDNDLTGVTLRVRLIPGRAPNESENWNTHQRVDTGSTQLHNSGTSARTEHYRETRTWESFIEAAAKAMAAPPENPFTIRLILNRTKNSKELE